MGALTPGTFETPNVVPFRARAKEPSVFDFDRIPVKFDWSNQAWIDGNLGHVRMAVVICNKDSDQMAEAVGGMLATEGDLAERLLEDIGTVRDHLAALAEMMTAAEARLTLTFERLGAGERAGRA